MEINIDTTPVRSIRISSFYLGSAIGLVAWGLGSPFLKFLGLGYDVGGIIGNLLGCLGITIIFYTILRFFMPFGKEKRKRMIAILLSIAFFVFSYTILQPGELLQTINDIFKIIFEHNFRSVNTIKNKEPFWPVSYIIAYGFLSFIAASCAESLYYLKKWNDRR
jgi:hypothetical protein